MFIRHIKLLLLCSFLIHPSIDANADGPAMWQITDENSAIYLFGTIHVLPPQIKWRTAKFEEAMEDATITVTEANADSAQASQIMNAFLATDVAKGKPFKSALTDELVRDYTKISRELGLPFSAIGDMPEWLANLVLADLAYKKAGFESESGADNVITEIATSQKDDLMYFETFELQLTMLATAFRDVSEQAYEMGIKQYEEFDSFTADMVEMWRSGEVEDLAALMEEQSSALDPSTKRILFTERNETWTEQIIKMLATDENHFIAVGAGHLAGENNVVELLLRRGLSVERIQ